MDLFDIAVAKKLAGGGGGSAQIIEVVGTVANPWGDLDFIELCDAIESGDVIAELTITSQDESFKTLLTSLASNIRSSFVNYNPYDGTFFATSGVWTSAGLARFDAWQGTGASNTYVNYKDLGAGLATELRIVHI